LFSDNQSDGIPYTIVTHSRPREVSERFAIDKEDFSSSARVISFSSEWIRRSVLASSGSVEVVEPEVIRTSIAQAARLILDRYESH